MIKMFTLFNQKTSFLLSLLFLCFFIHVNANPFSFAPTQEMSMMANAGIGEIDQVSVNHKWKYVAFDKTYENPVVVAGGPSYNGGDPTTVRIKNISSEGFMIRLDEWACQDEWHTFETVPYMVVEAGVYRLPNGRKLMAGKAENVNHRWTNIRFPQEFDRVPVVFASVASVRGGHSVVVRIRHNRKKKVTRSQFSAKLQEDRTSDKWHTKEDLCWIAVEAGRYRGGEATNFQFGRTKRIHDHRWSRVILGRGLGEKPIFFSSIITFHGGHTSNVRYDHRYSSGRVAKVFIDEEDCTGEGTRHPHKEKVGFAAFKQAGPIVGEKLDKVYAPCGEGFLTQEIWRNLDGQYDVGTIPVNTTPDETRTLTSFTITPDLEDYYGTRVRGYICAPVSGNYVFKIASDDNGELWLSSDDRASNKTKIAFVKGWTFPGEYDKYPEQISASIYLEAGKKYYIEALMKETAAEDNLSVAWELPDGQEEAPIAGIHLSPYNENAASQAQAFTKLADPNELELDVRIFPNPAHSYISLSVTGGYISTLEMSVQDLSGKSIWRKTGVTAGEEVNIDHLPTGIYLVRVKGADVDKSFKLVKQ
ncbi:MAG: PA14 domain-containing protein [Bacteroidota bacterium]